VREAVLRINADKAKYLQYFIDCHKDKDPEIGTLTVADMRASRVVMVDPAPIPDHELEATANWIKSWGMLEQTDDHMNLVNMDVQQGGHAAAE
jgi:NitT/TauT family transport system substrate-binding protein